MASREYLGLNPEGVTAFADQLRFAASQADEIAKEIRAAMVLSGLDGPAAEMKALSGRIDRVASAVRARSNQASSFRLPVLSLVSNLRATGPSISVSPGGFVVPVDTKHPLPPKWPTDTKHPNPVNWPKDTKHPSPTKFPTDTKHPTPVKWPTDTKHPWPTVGSKRRASTRESREPEGEADAGVEEAPESTPGSSEVDPTTEKPIVRVYEPNPKHPPAGSRPTRGSGGVQVSPQPTDGAGALANSTLDKPTSPARTGIDPETGETVTLRRHGLIELPDRIVEQYHGYVEPGRNK